MVPAIKKPLHVDPRDSLRSLVVRACRRRHLPHTWIIGERVGLSYRNRANFADSPNVDIDELSRLLEVSRDDVLARRHEAAGNGRVNYWGLAVPALFLETTHRRRFAPGAFGAGVPMPVHDTRWDMRLLPFCPRTWQMLERRCGCCGREQRWTIANGVDRCDSIRCVTSLSKTPARSVPTEMQERLSLAAGICSPIPAERQKAAARIVGLPDLTEQQAFDLLALLAMLVHGAKHGSVRISGPNTDPDDLLECVGSACDILLDWPGQLKPIDIGARVLSSSARVNFNCFLKRIRSEELARQLPSSILDRIIMSLSSTRVPRPGNSDMKSTGPAQRGDLVPDSIVGVRVAAESAGTARSTMVTAWNDGLVARLQRRHGDRQPPAFFLREAVAIGEAMRARVSASGVASRLGLPLYGVEQVLCLELLTARGLRLSTDWDRNFLIETDITALVDRLEAAKTTALHDPVQLVAALRAIPSRKPWGPLVGALLNGLRFQIADGDRPLFQRVYIDRSDIFRIRGLRFPYAAWPARFSTEAVLGDALEILNLVWKHNAVVFSKPITGSMPKHVAMNDILDLADLYVSTAELMASTGRSSAAIRTILMNAGLARPFPGCWLRMEAERELGLAGAGATFVISE